MDMKCGHFTSAQAVAINVICGFVPDLLILTNLTTLTMYRWWKSVADRGDIGLYGYQDASTGDWVACGDAANGIIALDSSGNYVMVESPIPGVGNKATAILTWAASAVKVARSGSVIGSMVRPAVRNGYVYECTGAGTTNDTEGEPVWPKTPGVSVTETDGVIWTCRNEQVVRGGGKGFQIGATLAVDSELWHFTAFRCDKDRYLGDAADGDLSIV